MKGHLPCANSINDRRDSCYNGGNLRQNGRNQRENAEIWGFLRVSVNFACQVLSAKKTVEVHIDYLMHVFHSIETGCQSKAAKTQ